MRYSYIFVIAAAALTCSVASAAPSKTSESVPFSRSCQTSLTNDWYDMCDAMELQADESVVIETVAATCWHEVDDTSDEFTKVISVHVSFKGVGDVYTHSIPVLLQKSESGPSSNGTEARVYYNGVINGPFYAEAGGSNKIRFATARTSPALSSGYAQCNLHIQGQYR